MTYFLRFSKIFLFLTTLTPLIILKGVLFPYVVGKMFFFRGAIEIALILFLFYSLYFLYKKKLEIVHYSELHFWQRSLQLFYNPLFIALILFFLSLVLSVIFALNPYRAFWGDLERGEGFFGLLHFFAFLILTLILFNKTDWLRFFKISLIVGFILSFYAFLQYSGVTKFPFALTPMSRPDSFIGNSAFLATHMCFLIVFAIVVFSESFKLLSPETLSKFKFSNSKIYNLFWRYFSVFMLIMSVLTIFISGTRGAILGLAAGIVFLLIYFLFFGQKFFFGDFFERFSGEFSGIKLPFKTNLRQLSLILLILIAGLTMIFWFTKSNNFWQSIPGFDRLAKTATLDINDSSTQMRLIAWSASFEAFKERPLLGWGPENYIFAYAKYYDPAYAVYGETWFDRAHNKILDILVMQGIFGLISYLAVFGVIFYVIFKKITERKFAFTFIAAAILAYFIQSIVIFDQIISYSAFFSIIGFLIFSLMRSREENIIQTSSLGIIKSVFFLKLRLIIISLILVFIILLFYSIYAYNFIVYSQLRALSYSSKLGRIDLVVGELKKAFEPYNFAQLNIRGQGLDTAYLNQYFYNEIYRNNIKFKPLGDLWINAVEEFLNRESYADVRMNIREVEMFDQLAFGDNSLYKKIENILIAAIEKAPNRQELYYHLSVNLAKQNRFEEALKYADYALSLNTNVTRAHFYKGLVLAANNKDEEAKKELTLAEEMDAEYSTLFSEDKRSMVMLYTSWGMVEKVAELAVKNINHQTAFPMEREDFENSLRYYLVIHNALNSIKIAEFLSQYEDLKGDMAIIINLIKSDNWKTIDNLY